MMKLKNLFILSLAGVCFTACFGDKKTVNIEEMNDTTSFINKNFKGNLIDFKKGMSACNQLSASEIANIYNVSTNLVVIDDPKTNPNRQETDTPICSFYIESGDSDFMWLRGSISVNREINANEYMGDIAEATGGGENWEEAWALKKSMSKSAEWVANTGKAALWNESKSQLEIKFDGYTLNVFPLKNNANQEEKALNRNYKDAAMAMAKAAGYIN